MMVNKLLDKTDQQNPFIDHCPGKDWWYAFLQHHPELAMPTPECLQPARATCCSEEVLSRWYDLFKQFLELNNVCDLSGFGMQMKLVAHFAPSQGR